MQTSSHKRKRRSLSTARALLFLLFVLAAVAVAFTLFLKFYVPDPDTNVNIPVGGTGDDFPGVGTSGGETDFTGKLQKAGRYNFLIVGLDRASRSTDIMMIVSYDVGAGRISVVQLPRDTYVKTADVTTVRRINSYYAVYYNRANKNGDADPDMAALTGLAAMIEKNFGVRINYSAVVDLDGFVNIIDAVGGVWIDVPYDMFYEDPYQDLYIDLKAGYQHLDGERAMQFVRFRKGYVQQDIGRQDALKNFMAALMAQLKQNLNISTVVGVSGEVMKNMRSNIGAADFVYFAKSALSVDLSNVMMETLPGEPTMVDGASVYVLYRDDTIDVLNKYLNVFDRPLTREEFDRDEVMFVHGDDTSEEIYNSPAGTASSEGYNAGDINENPIDIPRR